MAMSRGPQPPLPLEDQDDSFTSAVAVSASIAPGGHVVAGILDRPPTPRLPQVPVVEPWARLPQDGATDQQWRSLNLSLLAGSSRLTRRARSGLARAPGSGLARAPGSGKATAPSSDRTANSTQVFASTKDAKLPADGHGILNVSINGSTNASQYPDDYYPYGDGERVYPIDVKVPTDDNEYGKNPFGTGLLTELHLPHVTLRQLHTKSKGSLARFLLDLRRELSKVTRVEEERLSIVGIHGRYQRMDAIDGDEPVRLNEEVLVKLEFMDGAATETKPLDMIQIVKNELQPEGALAQGPLKFQLTNATITLGTGTSSDIHNEAERRGAARLSAMALPIGISAAFTAILIWLAAG